MENRKPVKEPGLLTGAFVVNIVTISMWALSAVGFIFFGGLIFGLVGGASGNSGIAAIGVGLSVFIGILFLIPLAWCIPMTVRLNKYRKAKVCPSIAHGVCTLLFCNIISGILLLVASD